MEVKSFIISPLHSNCYVLTADMTPGAEAVIVDPGDIELERIFTYIDEHQFVPKAVWCTHAHFDHVVGVDLVRDRYQIPAYVHASDMPVWNEMHDRAQQWAGLDVPALRAPDGFWEAGRTATVGDTAFQIVHTPGHSPGGVCFVSEDIILTGDTLFAGTIGRTDLAYSDGAAMEQSLKEVARFPMTAAVYPGHGPRTTMDRELRVNPFLQG